MANRIDATRRLVHRRASGISKTNASLPQNESLPNLAVQQACTRSIKYTDYQVSPTATRRVKSQHTQVRESDPYRRSKCSRYFLFLFAQAERV